MEKRIFLKSALVDSHDSIDSIGSIDSIESEDSTDSTDSIDFIDSKHRQHSHHTQRGRAIVPMGAAPSKPPPLVVSFSLCVWCECWRSFVWHEYRI